VKLIKVFVDANDTEFMNPEKVNRAWLSPGGPKKNGWYWRFRFESGEEAVTEGFPTEAGALLWARRVGIEVVDE